MTYVSRVPPEIDSSPDQTVARHQEGAISVADNPWLIALVLEALGKQPATPATIGNAVATVPAPLDGSPARLGQIVPWWQKLVDSTRGSSPDQKALPLLNQILLDTADYVQKGFRTKALPPA